MIDLRNFTDYERQKYFTCNIPDWIYFPAAAVAVLVVLGIAAPLVVGVIGKVMRVF